MKWIRSIYFILLVVLWSWHALLGQERPALLRGVDLARLQRLRPQPPFDQEVGYELLKLWSAEDTVPSVSGARWKQRLAELVIGAEVRMSPKWTLGLDGLIHVVSTANPVDGVWLGYEVYAAYRPKLGHRLVLRSANSTTTRTRQWMSANHALYFYAPKRAGLLVLSGGRTSQETLHLSNEEQFAGLFPGLIGTNSPLRGYLRHFVSLRNSIYLTPHLRFNALMQYEDRRPQLLGLPAHQALVGEVGLYYDLARVAPRWDRFATPIQTPRGYYAPELGLMYRAGLVPTASDAGRPFSAYRLIEGSLRGAYAWDGANKLYWGVTAGTFLNRSRVFDADERYLPTLGLAGRSPFIGHWSTLAEQDAGTRWLWGSVDYTASRLLLTRLMGRGLDEALHARALWGAPQKRWYEVGYSIGAGEMLRVGVFAGMDLQGHVRWHVNLSAPVLFLSSTASTRY